ncbi:MAG: C39 family peptidase [Candidatus Parcubacteria bacterium]|nr:C39 family peptidase [Candidatus Parcubacteria bacterium]
MRSKRLIIFGIIVIALIFICAMINKKFFVFALLHRQVNVPISVQPKYNLPITKNSAPKTITTPNSVAVPDKFLLTVPFTSQAPFGVWDPVHNDACEEAALIMAKSWVDGHLLNATIADKEILEAVAWEAKTWGQQYELTAERMATLGKDFLGLKNIKIFAGLTTNDMKSQLSQGNLILVPVAGRLLGNPYYRQPGPIYHILVIKGYNEQEFITNDAGTRRGESYSYFYQTLLNAVHDWPYGAPDFGINIAKDVQAQKILTGQRAMLVISKN